MLSISVPSRSNRRAFMTAPRPWSTTGDPPRGSSPAWGGPALGLVFSSDALLEAGLDQLVEVAVQHLLRVGDLDVGAQVLDAALVQHVAADLVAPAHVGLAVFELLLLGHLLAHLVLV